MSDQNTDIASFFDKEQQKKKKTQKSQQLTQQKKAQELQKKVEEEKKAVNTGDFESSDEEDTKGHIEIGVGSKVKDIKEVKKEKQLQEDAQKGQAFQWGDLGKGIAGAPASQPVDKDAAKAADKKGFTRGGMINPPQTASQVPQHHSSGAAATGGKEVSGINFSKGPPKFSKKAEQVVHKAEFPELGDDVIKKETKASTGGALGQVTAPARGARTQNKFEGLQEADEKTDFISKHASASAAEPKADAPSKGPPKFSGMKNFLSKQNNENAEANKNLEEFKKKINDNVVIHEAKPPRREEGEEGKLPHAVGAPATSTGSAIGHGEKHVGERRRVASDVKEVPTNGAAADKEDSDDDFEKVDSDKKRGGDRGAKAGRGGPRGRGGFYRGDREPREEGGDHHQRREDRPHHAEGGKPTTHASAPAKKEEAVKNKPVSKAEFESWDAANLF